MKEQRVVKEKTSLLMTSRKLVIVFASVVFFAILIGGAYFCYELARSCFVSGKSFLSQKIVAEQVEHFGEIKEVVVDIEDSFWILDEYVGELEDGGSLNTDDKAEIQDLLRDIEKDSFFHPLTGKFSCTI